MSRLYEALSHSDRDDPIGVDWRKLSVDTPKTEPQSEPGETPGGAKQQAASEPAPSENSVRPVEAAVDIRARLLPFAVNTVVVEHYRRLRTKILQKQAADGFHTLLVTSAGEQEGKTLTVMNLALSFAMLPAFRVLVVDGDLRRGTISRWLGADSSLPGLSNVIDGSAGLAEAILRSEDIPMPFMVRGNSVVPAAELLNSARLGELVRTMGKQFDLVLVDSPPVHLVTDAHLLAGYCDAVMMVARAFSTTRKSFDRAVQDLGPVNVIGTVLNGGPVQRSHRYGYYQEKA